MPLNLLLNLLFSLIDLAKGSLIFSIPVYLIVLIGVFLRRFFEKKYKLNWFKSSLAATYLLMFALPFFLYISFPAASFGEVTIGEIPYTARPIGELVFPIILSFIRLLVVAAVLTLMLLPLEFVGVFIFDKQIKRLALIKSKKWSKLNYFINLYISVFILSLFTAFVILFLFPWILPGVIYLIFFGLG